MVRCIGVSFSELQKGNKRLCLSVKRGINRCFDCHLYDKCESKIVNIQYEQLRLKQRQIREIADIQIKDINKEIETL